MNSDAMFVEEVLVFDDDSGVIFLCPADDRPYRQMKLTFDGGPPDIRHLGGCLLYTDADGELLLGLVGRPVGTVDFMRLDADLGAPVDWVGPVEFNQAIAAYRKALWGHIKPVMKVS